MNFETRGQYFLFFFSKNKVSNPRFLRCLGCCGHPIYPLKCPLHRQCGCNIVRIAEEGQGKRERGGDFLQPFLVFEKKMNVNVNVIRRHSRVYLFWQMGMKLPRYRTRADDYATLLATERTHA